MTVRVQDTIPPELDLHPYTADLTEEITPEKFVEKVSDASDVSLRFQDPQKWDEAKSTASGSWLRMHREIRQ